MSENVISINGSGEICNNDDSEIEKIGNDLLKTTDQILLDIRADIPKKNIISISIAELSALGAGVSPLIPSFRNITHTTTIDTGGANLLIFMSLI